MNDWTFQPLGRLTRFLGLGIVAVWLSSSCGYSAQPGELFEYPIAKKESVQTLRLRYCPPGTIYPGRPNSDRNTSSLELPPIKVRGF
jgi:hypothetical protein